MNTRKPDMSPHKTQVPMLEVSARINNFDEAVLGYTKEQAMAEAARCMNCPERYCAAHCPAHTYIPEFIAEVREGNFEQAYQLIARTNPLMGISGRICPQEYQCESHCTRGIKSEPVAIGRLERFVSDWHAVHSKAEPLKVSGLDMRIAVVGSGPAAITCALSLAKSGFDVTIFEKSSHLGGVLSWGIPSFVLPAALLAEQLTVLSDAGVKVKSNMALGRDISAESLRKEYDAVFIAVGAGKPIPMGAEGADLPGVLQATDYLSAALTPAGKNVVVLGGGNTAIDVARTAIRAGAESVRLAYRRTEAEMPATRDEIAIAKEEGVEFVVLVSPVRFVSGDGKLSGVECDKMQFTAPDYPGGRKNVCPSGETTTLDADLAVLAFGFENEPVAGLELDSANRIVVDDNYATSMEGVFAGGDAVTGASTLMKAAAAGKDAATSIFKFLS